MLTRHVSRRLAAYVDGQLDAADAQAVEAHLARCERCRADLDEIRFASNLVRQLAVEPAPETIWPAIDAELTVRQGAADRAPFPLPPAPWSVWRLAPAVLLLIVAGAGAYWYSTRATSAWRVERSDRSGIARMTTGEWIETRGGSRATIAVGNIGTVAVEPGSRVGLGAARPDEYRISLVYGTINAKIDAPPRLFFVETPTSTVVDLGCAYTMHVDDEGAGELRVTEGWASLEWNGRESLVPAGARGHTRPGAGPGTPYFEDAPPRLQDAVASFDFANGGADALNIILAEARVRDTLTLWHLMSRVDAGDRARVFDRVAELTPPPATVSREKALALDPATLKHWREELAWTW
ncbi:MAG TPA: zf-HC2 domain-containing protein [Vicinamibacterales bacterium]|nr:zf-HC2 domain-containing protein [Vicinamibacterales bacterium]